MSISKQVKELREFEIEWIQDVSRVAGIMRQAADTIESLSAKLEDMERTEENCSGWIYCGDGKSNPQKFGRYLCMMESGEVMKCSYEWNVPHTKRSSSAIIVPGM